MHAFKNGEVIAPDSLLERGFVYGDGFFETMRVVHGRIPLVQYHLERAIQAANRLKIPLDSTELLSGVETLLSKLNASQAAASVMKLLISRSWGGRGAYPLESCSINEKDGANIYALIKALPDYLLSSDRHSIELVPATMRLPENTPFAGLKLIARTEYSVAAQPERVDKNQELLFINSREYVIETMHHNIFFLDKHVLKTPSMPGFGVKGVMRRYLLEDIASKMHLSVEQGNYTMQNLLKSDGVFITNAIEGVVRVTSINNCNIKSAQKIPEIQRLANAVFRS